MSLEVIIWETGISLAGGLAWGLHIGKNDYQCFLAKNIPDFPKPPKKVLEPSDKTTPTVLTTIIAATYNGFMTFDWKMVLAGVLAGAATWAGIHTGVNINNYLMKNAKLNDKEIASYNKIKHELEIHLRKEPLPEELTKYTVQLIEINKKAVKKLNRQIIYQMKFYCSETTNLIQAYQIWYSLLNNKNVNLGHIETAKDKPWKILIGHKREIHIINTIKGEDDREYLKVDWDGTAGKAAIITTPTLKENRVLIYNPKSKTKLNEKIIQAYNYFQKGPFQKYLLEKHLETLVN